MRKQKIETHTHAHAHAHAHTYTQNIFLFLSLETLQQGVNVEFLLKDQPILSQKLHSYV